MKYREYGKNEKVIMFSDTDKRHAELILKLRRDGLSAPQFFRSLVTGYIENEVNIVRYISDVKSENARIGKKKIEYIVDDIDKGNQILSELGMTEKDVDFIFDLIERGEDDF